MPIIKFKEVSGNLALTHTVWVNDNPAGRIYFSDGLYRYYREGEYDSYLMEKEVNTLKKCIKGLYSDIP